MTTVVYWFCFVGDIFPNSPSSLCSSEQDRVYGGGGDSGNATESRVQLKAAWLWRMN